MLDILNEQLVSENKEPVAFDHDCREGQVNIKIRQGTDWENTFQDSGPRTICLLYTSTILEKFNLLHDGKLNNASAVLFGRYFYFYPHCLLRWARFKGTTKDEFIDNQRTTGNIYTLLDTCLLYTSRCV